ncbi:MAG: hypothetical protein EXS36_18875 [Pedosphaera sp.]|nr:hypothetical protein [Pedosphaera sp.]
MKKLYLAALSASAVLALSGCFQTQEGNYQAGLPAARDTIESKYERTTEEVFEAAKKALIQNGTIVSENLVSKSLKARVDTSTVWVRIEQAEPNIARIWTQVRNSKGTGDIRLASELDKQTALQLRVLPSNQIPIR